MCVGVLVLYAIIFVPFGNCALSEAAAVRAGRNSSLCTVEGKLLFVILIKLNHQLLLSSPQIGLM